MKQPSPCTDPRTLDTKGPLPSPFFSLSSLVSSLVAEFGAAALLPVSCVASLVVKSRVVLHHPELDGW